MIYQCKPHFHCIKAGYKMVYINLIFWLIDSWCITSWDCTHTAGTHSKPERYKAPVPRRDTIIMKTCPYNVYPLVPRFYKVKFGYTGVHLFFLFLLQNIDCVLTSTHNLYFGAKIRKYKKGLGDLRSDFGLMCW